MKIDFGELTLIEIKVLTDVLVAFRSGQPFSHPGRAAPLQNTPKPKET